MPCCLAQGPQRDLLWSHTRMSLKGLRTAAYTHITPGSARQEAGLHDCSNKQDVSMKKAISGGKHQHAGGGGHAWQHRQRSRSDGARMCPSKTQQASAVAARSWIAPLDEQAAHPVVRADEGVDWLAPQLCWCRCLRAAAPSLSRRGERRSSGSTNQPRQSHHAYPGCTSWPMLITMRASSTRLLGMHTLGTWCVYKCFLQLHCREVHIQTAQHLGRWVQWPVLPSPHVSNTTQTPWKISSSVPSLMLVSMHGGVPKTKSMALKSTNSWLTPQNVQRGLRDLHGRLVRSLHL
jgi:hypothetical protein